MALRLTPNVFIVSSRKGLREARAIARQLGRDGKIDVRTWVTEFKGTEYHHGTLQRAILQFDFAVVVITPDDLTEVVRDMPSMVFEPRDNVIFELGLFSSGLGSRHVLPVVVTKDGRKPSLPTDLAGLVPFPVTVASRRSDGPLRRVAAKMRTHIFEHYLEPGLGLLPSTALAIGYVENFIKPLNESLTASRVCTVRGKPGDPDELREVDPWKWRLIVCLPQDLSKVSNVSWARRANQLRLDLAEIKLPPKSRLPRVYPFRVGVSARRGELTIFDTPTTLKTVYATVRRLLPDATRADNRLADERGTADFKNALLQLVAAENLSNHVRVVGWDELSPSGVRATSRASRGGASRRAGSANRATRARRR